MTSRHSIPEPNAERLVNKQGAPETVAQLLINESRGAFFGLL